MSDEEIRKLGGKPAWEIEKADQSLENRLANAERYLWPPGQPDLETRMRAFAEAAILHKHANALQAVTVLDGKVDLKINHMEERSEDRHKQNIAAIESNGRKTDAIADKVEEHAEATSNRLNKMVWAGLVGALAMAGTLAMQVINMLHK